MATSSAQVIAMFANVRRIVEAGGGSTDDILKMTLWVHDRGARSIIDPALGEDVP